MNDYDAVRLSVSIIFSIALAVLILAVVVALCIRNYRNCREYLSVPASERDVSTLYL
jgi:hypothetical protein